MQPQFIILHHNAKDITDHKFGRLIALGPTGRSKHRHIIWLCQCDCGNICQVSADPLLAKRTRSCGCLAIEGIIARTITHGLHSHPLYYTWHSMIQRCKNTDRKHKYYSDSGIQVCEEWQNDIKSFILYAEQLPHAGEKGYSLDRIDNSLGYFPGNIRFSTYPEQNRNTRRNHFITHNGKTQCVTDWATELGFSVGTICSRLRLGWGIERTLTQPVGKYEKKPSDRTPK